MYPSNTRPRIRACAAVDRRVKETHYTNHPQNHTQVSNIVSPTTSPSGAPAAQAVIVSIKRINQSVPARPLSVGWCRKICMTYSDSHGMVVAGDMIGNIVSWKIGEVSAVNTDNGDVPPHHVLGGHMTNKRCVQMPHSKVSVVGIFSSRTIPWQTARLNAEMFCTLITSMKPC